MKKPPIPMRLLTALLLSALASLSVASAEPKGSQVHGRVRDAGGRALEGANVWVVGRTPSGIELKSLRTNKEGRFELSSLPSGLYAIRISLLDFHPQVEENLRISASEERWLEIKLEPKPASARRSSDARALAAADWRWVLRTSAAAKRSVLRFLPEERQRASGASGRAVLLSGANPGEGALAANASARFEYRPAEGYSASVSVLGSASSKKTAAGAALSTRWQAQNLDSAPELTFAVGYQALPGSDGKIEMRSYRLGSAQEISLPGEVELAYRVDYVRLDLGSLSSVILPEAEVRRQLGDRARIFYAYRSEAPVDSFGLDSAELAHRRSERLPILTMVDGRPALERIARQEIGLDAQIANSQRLVAVAYVEKIENAALPVRGAGPNLASFLLLADVRGAYVNGGDLSGRGFRLAHLAKWTDRLSSMVTYVYGTGLAPQPEAEPLETPGLELKGTLEKRRAHSLGARVLADLPYSETTVKLDYRWVSKPLLTPIGKANSAETQMQPFLSFRIRQPIPPVFFLPQGLTILAAAENVLNQGAQPVILADGTQVEIMPVFRSFRGGLAYSF